MIATQKKLCYLEKTYQPCVIHKMIGDQVIKAADTLHQKPSRSLLKALMDLVDVLGGKNLASLPQWTGLVSSTSC